MILWQFFKHDSKVGHIQLFMFTIAILQLKQLLHIPQLFRETLMGTIAIPKNLITPICVKFPPKIAARTHFQKISIKFYYFLSLLKD
jgi:hypothetical protein